MSADLRGSLEENVLTLLCTSSEHAPFLLLELTPDLFSTRQFRKVAEVAIEHIERFNQAPGPHLRDLLEKDLRRGEEGILLQRILADIEQLAPALQPDYVLAELGRFVTLRKLAIQVEKAADALAAGDVEGVQEAMSPVDTKAADSPGIWLSDPQAALSFLDVDDEELMSSGIEVLDKYRVCPIRGGVFLWLGKKKIGKTWALINTAKANLMRRRSVLHISLEMPDKQVAKRYVQALFAMSTTSISSVQVPVFQKDSFGKAIDIDFDTLNPEWLRREIKPKIASKLAALRNRPRLLIKDFPTSSLTVAQLRAYLVRLEKVENFKPDMVILDYAKIMNLDPKNLRISAGHTMEQLRGLAKERDFALVTAWQGNRASDKAKTTTSGHISEDWSIAGTVDTLCSISRTPAEKKRGLARILVDAARDAEDEFVVMISQSYATGQFCIDSVYMNRYLAEEVDKFSGDQDDEDDD